MSPFGNVAHRLAWRAIGTSMLLSALPIACDDAVGPSVPERIAELSAVATGGGRFVAVGGWFWAADATVPNSDSVLIVSSSDGITWETATVTAAGWLHAVSYGDGRFLAVGSHDVNGIGPPTSTPVVFTSVDGRTWEAAIDPPALQWRSVAYGAGRFVALGLDPTTTYTGIVTTTDGVSWNDDLITDILSAEVTFGDTTFVLWGEAGAVGVSSNGIDWEVVPVDSVNRVLGIAYVNGAFIGNARFDCCFGERPDLIVRYDLSSTDGTRWSVHRRAEPAESFYAYAEGSSRIVALGGDAIFTSMDGITWQRAPGSVRHVNALAYGNGRFIAVGRVGLTSTDGLAWSAVDVFQ